MAGITFGLFTLSFLLFFGGGNYFLASQRSGVYPPRRVLQQKALAISGAGGIILFLAVIAMWIA